MDFRHNYLKKGTAWELQGVGTVYSTQDRPDLPHFEGDAAQGQRVVGVRCIAQATLLTQPYRKFTITGIAAEKPKGGFEFL
jgi:hypothetical protein